VDLKTFSTAFRYKADRHDSWRVLKAPYQGDCDDYAATALWITESGWRGFWWAVLTFRAVFWLVRDPQGVRHVVLWHRKHGYIDNQFPYWRDRMAPHKRLVPFLAPAVALKLLIGKVRG
jgi:hypothetical protein